MFVVLHTEAVPDHVRGYVSRFLTEATPGLFIGTCTRVVAENLWGRVCDALGTGSATMAFTDPATEIGHSIRTHGRRAPGLVDLDGLQLTQRRLMGRDGGGFGGDVDAAG